MIDCATCSDSRHARRVRLADSRVRSRHRHAASPAARRPRDPPPMSQLHRVGAGRCPATRQVSAVNTLRHKHDLLHRCRLTSVVPATPGLCCLVTRQVSDAGTLRYKHDLLNRCRLTYDVPATPGLCCLVTRQVSAVNTLRHKPDLLHRCRLTYDVPATEPVLCGHATN